jgi:branched-chain amino acid transport system permease protein
MNIPYDLIVNALVAGLLLGAFYAAVTVGVSISFGILDIVNIAHPGFIILGSYIAYIVNTRLGLDPIAVSIAMLPAFYALGALIYQAYYASFERYGQESLRGLAFFFGLLFVTEVSLILVFGVDYRYVEAAYIGPSLCSAWPKDLTLVQAMCARNVDVPLRMLVPCLVALALFGALQVYLTRTFMGRAIMAVAQDQLALQLMGASPTRIKRAAFAISIATAAVAGALLIVIQPVEPSIGREYIGRVFAICVLGGLGSLTGTLVGAMLLGIVESFTSTFYGPSWAPAVSFGVLLLTLAFRPQGLFGR